MTTSAGEPADSAEAPDRPEPDSPEPDSPEPDAGAGERTEGAAVGAQIDDNSMPFDMRDKYHDSPSSSDRVDPTADSATHGDDPDDADSATHGDDPDDADDTPS